MVVNVRTVLDFQEAQMGQRQLVPQRAELVVSGVDIHTDIVDGLESEIDALQCTDESSTFVAYGF